MKILLLAPQPFYQERGTPIAVDLLLRALSARGDEVDVLTYQEGTPVTYPGVTIHRIPRLPFVRHVRPGPSFKKLLCDAVLAVLALRMAARTRYQLVHAVEESAFIALVITRVFKTPYLYDMDSSMADQLGAKYAALRPLNQGLRALERLAIRRADVVVPVCDALADIATRSGARKVVVLRDISLLSFDGHTMKAGGALKSELGLHGPTVMYVGNLERYQGLDLLLESFSIARARVPAAQLVVIGGDPQAIRRYEAMAARLALGASVHFIGPRPVAQLAECFEAADVLVSPRLSGGNTPMKIYSYLASGKAILATDLPTHTQVLGEDVALLRAPTPEAFADGMVRLIEDATLRRRLGEAGRALAEQRHSYPSFQATLNALYTGIEREIAGRTSPTTTATAQNRAGWMRTVSLRAGISIALLWLILRKLDLQMVGALLWRIDWRFALAASSLYMVNRWITTVEWRLLLQAKGLRFSFRRLLRVVWIGNLFGHFLPAGVGGDSVRLVTMARERQPLPEIASSLLIERLNGALSLAALAVLGALWSYQYWKISMVAVALVLPLFTVVIAALLLWTTPGDRLLTWMIEHVRWLPGHQFFLKMHAAVKAYRRQPRAVAASFLLSELTQVNRVAAIFLLAKALGMTLFIGEAFVLAPTALFISMLPISIDGIGVGEGAFVLLLGPAGIGAPGAFALSLMARVARLLSFLPTAPSFLVNGLRGLPMAAEVPAVTPVEAQAQEIRRSSGQRLRVLRVIDRLGYGDRMRGFNRKMMPTSGATSGEPIGGILHRLRTEWVAARRKTRGDVQGLLLRRYPKWLFTGDDEHLKDSITVFTFHEVQSDWFDQQLAYLQANQYHILPDAEALYRCLRGEERIPPRAILLTFDDAGATLYTTAFPLLKRYGMHGVSFVVPTFLDKPNFCTWNQIEEMHRSGVIDIQSHTLCHRFAPKWPQAVRCLGTTTEAEDEARRHPAMLDDYRRARDIIEARLEKPVRHLCYPDYDGTDESVAASQSAGYLSNFWGVLPSRRTNRTGDDPFRIVRVSSEYLRSLPGKGRQSPWRIAAEQARHHGRWKLQRLAGRMSAH